MNSIDVAKAEARGRVVLEAANVWSDAARQASAASRAKANSASAHAWNKSKAADSNSAGYKEQTEAHLAHYTAQGIHEDAAKFHLNRTHDGVGTDTRAQDASDHQVIARVHERESARYKAAAQVYHGK